MGRGRGRRPEVRSALWSSTTRRFVPDTRWSLVFSKESGRVSGTIIRSSTALHRMGFLVRPRFRLEVVRLFRAGGVEQLPQYRPPRPLQFIPRTNGFSDCKTDASSVLSLGGLTVFSMDRVFSKTSPLYSLYPFEVRVYSVCNNEGHLHNSAAAQGGVESP